jgi:hypothetical protein
MIPHLIEVVAPAVISDDKIKINKIIVEGETKAQYKVSRDNANYRAIINKSELGRLIGDYRYVVFCEDNEDAINAVFDKLIAEYEHRQT